MLVTVHPRDLGTLDRTRRFRVFDGHQLHGDLGERLGKTRRYSLIEWARRLVTQHPDSPDAKGKNAL